MRKPSSDRAAALHNAGTRGKTYDIISGVLVTNPSQPPGAPTLPAPALFDRRAHPSNISMPHSGVHTGGPAHRGSTAPTLIGPIPDAHMATWQPSSPAKSPSKAFFM